jgi:PKD repeat protein
VASATPASGGVPLVVQLSSAGSSDPDLDPLTVAWSFGDGSGSSAASPSHTYTAGGRYQVILTVTDGRGGLSRDTVYVVALTSPVFPSTQVLDRFQRPDGVIGAPWFGSTSGLAIRDQALVQLGTTSYGIWDAGIFGPDQEVHATFDAVTDSAEHDLLLKVQGRSWVDGHVQVHYDARHGGTLVLTYDAFSGWRRIAGPFPMRLLPGDVFGGRAYSNGDIEVYQNGVVRGVASVAGWPFAASGGRLGVLLAKANATRMTSFGGGDLVLEVNRRPNAVIQSPAGSGFYAAGDTIRLAGFGVDPEDLPGALDYRWEVDLHHNQHVHPGFVVADLPSTFLVAEDHDDGSGVWLRGRFIVTDTQGASDTTSVDLHPEIDLVPSAVGTIPTVPGTSEPTLFRFTIDNPARMPAPRSHWRLVAGSLTLAEGDTLVPAHGRVLIERLLPPTLPAGTHDVRVAVDTLGQVTETNEANNADSRRLIVVSGPGVLDADKLPRTLELSPAYPNPSAGRVAFRLDLPGAAEVELAVFDIQGREVFRAPRRLHAAGSWTLAWDGRSGAGGRAQPGLYLARVRAGERVFHRRLAMVR